MLGERTTRVVRCRAVLPIAGFSLVAAMGECHGRPWERSIEHPALAVRVSTDADLLRQNIQQVKYGSGLQSVRHVGIRSGNVERRELNTTSLRIQYSVPRLTNTANDLARKRPKACAET